MKTSMIILTYNKLEYTKQCIESIRKYTDKDTYEIIIVDNNSEDGTVQWLNNQKDIKIIFNKENLGFPKGCNQGIRVAQGDNILLLNNDVIVTPNWLENLMKCLYSSDDIGAVGAVTNSCSNFQSIPKQYDTYDELINFAEKFNISSFLKWEERLKLIGYCMLIKKEVIQKVGLLDEDFTPGNYEDDDYCLRIRMEGYRIMLCKDTFIHHYGSVTFGKERKEYCKLLATNMEKFKSKWGVETSCFGDIRNDITSMIIKSKRECFNVLHIGCGSGATLLDIKNQIPTANLFGIEKNHKVVINTGHFADISIGSLEKIKNYPKDFFDYVIITESNKCMSDYKEIFLRIKELLKNEGKVIVTVPKELNKEGMFNLIDYTKAVFKKTSYEIFKNNIDILLYIIVYKKCFRINSSYCSNKKTLNNKTLNNKKL
ncbi:glycosyltransferase [Oceanirhabdus seepicola]|uniref:Glycosyltransferase n=1 Tax=Oceanirhabdus seepicola TaxID=2828781 RepID=A0A9J6NZI6_9CLOT|nr:glycosyltransferase [Oceanirhabdus seepicola]MCM1989289.1 glycosyltransferase [Oceanirhabdus seepicola]